jgi:hypothetical protein
MKVETSSANYMGQRSAFIVLLDVLYVLNCLIFFLLLFLRGIFWWEFSFYVYSSQIPLCRRMLRSNPGQLRLRHWLSDDLTTRLHLKHTRLDLIHTRLDLIHLYSKLECDMPCLHEATNLAHRAIVIDHHVIKTPLDENKVFVQHVLGYYVHVHGH